MATERTKGASEGIAPMGISPITDTVLSNQPESRYECPVCLNWLHEPMITTCGHRFCKSCITSWLQNSGHCPIDNVNLAMKVDIFPDNYTRREIQEQRMSCPFAAKGCNAKVAPLELDNHITNCPYNAPEHSEPREATVPCAFQPLGCKDTFESQDQLAEHLQDNVQQHMSYLMNAYSEMKINSDMSNTNMDGKAAEAMCMWDPDKNQEQSTSGNINNNVGGLIKSLYERVVVLEQRNREQDIVIANISKQLSAFTIAKRKQHNELSLRYCLGNYIWRIDNYQTRLEAMLMDHSKMLYSPGFYTAPNGYRFCIRLNISPQNPNCFALHLHLMKTENDECLEWPFSGRISITMLNQYDYSLSQKDTMMSNTSLIAFQRPTAEICLRGFGYTEYAMVNDVSSNGFVMNDTLIIRVHIKSV